VPTEVPGPEPSSLNGRLPEVKAMPGKIFSIPWDDLAPYRANLRTSEWESLQEMAGAPQYRISLTIGDSLRQIICEQEMLYTNQEETALDKIVFRIYPALFGATVKITSTRVDDREISPSMAIHPSVMTIPLQTPLQPGNAVVLALTLEYTMPEDATSNYNIFSSMKGLLTLPHFYPMAAVYDEEGWHTEIPPNYGDVTYSDASLYLVRVHAPANLTIITSGTQISQSKSGSIQTMEFSAGPARDFFLAAGDDLVKQTRRVNDVQVSSYTFSGMQEGSKTALDAAARSLESFSAMLGPYPYTEFDVISTHTSAAGVEYPGVTVINKDIYDPNTEFGGQPSEVMMRSVIVHEMAHQWFYNLIGNDQVNEPWLDESLAQYVTYRVFSDWFGSQGAKGYLASFYQRWDQVDQENIPIGQPVSAYTQKEYGAIIYGRGAIFFVKLEDQIGTDEIDQFLLAYSDKYKWKIASSVELEADLEESCDCQLDSTFQEWISP
jgi:hypothetical protein